MTDHPGFLADILDRPDDDVPRLIYADWLEDNGDDYGQARGEFIRLQIRVPSTEAKHLTTYNSASLSEHPAGRLLCRFGHGWLGPLYETGWGRNCPWGRGFIDLVGCPLAAWEEHGPAVVSRHPVRRVEVTDLPAGPRLGPPGLGQFYGIDFRQVGSPTIREVLGRAASVLYSNPDHLHQDASDGLLAWARQQARARGLWPGVPARTP